MSAVAVPAPAARTRRPGVGAVYRWELRKLAAQKRTYIGLVSAVAVPLIFVIAMAVDPPNDPGGLPFAAFVRDTGFAVPLVCLAFGAFWLLPLITALVAGDIVANEDQNGTLKTILTRSVERWHVFAGKVLAALTYTAVVLVFYVGVALVSGGLIWGFDPLTTLSGTTIEPGRALLLTGAGTLAYLLPMSADRGDRDPALDGHPQLRRGRRGHADGVDLLPDHRLDLGARRARPLPAVDPVQRLAGHPARADRLGSDRPLGLGLRAVRAPGAGLGADHVPATRRDRRLTADIV